MPRELTIGESALITDLSLCLNYYRLFSPGLYCCTHVTVELDDGNRFQPDVMLMVNHGRFKQAESVNDYQFFRGPPNFVLDVFPAGDMLDYDDRRASYERAGVIEYVAVRDTQPLTWAWNRLTDGEFQEIEADHEQTILSSALPGLWIRTHDLRKRDWWSIMATIARGVTRKGHHEYMDAIWNA